MTYYDSKETKSLYDSEDYASLSDPYTKFGRVVSKYFKQINVRKNPLPNSDIIAVVKVGTELQYIPEDDGDFYPVKLANDQKGYMMTKFVEEI